MKTTNIFVYGTLRRSFGNHALLANATYLGTARTLESFVMHSSGHIPFVSRSQSVSTILGEVYQISAPTLQRLDRLESCYPISPESFDAQSWYTREEIKVKMPPPINKEGKEDSSEIENTETILSVWMYTNEKETQHPIIPTGDFADRDRFLFGGKTKWYFAYGSNMNAQRMVYRKAFFTRRIKATLRMHRLVFNKIATTEPGYGLANVEADNYENVQGILYEIQESDLIELDKHEGVKGQHYERKTMTVETENGSVEAVVYVAHPSKIQNGLIPTVAYAENLYKGLDLLGEYSRWYLDRAILEARVYNGWPFLHESDIPKIPENVAEGEVQEYAIDALLDGIPVKMYTYALWSERLVVKCEPEGRAYFESLGMRIEGDGLFVTKYFQSPRRGILQIAEWRFVLEFRVECLGSELSPLNSQL